MDNFYNNDTISVAISYSRKSNKNEVNRIIEAIHELKKKRSYNIEIYIDKINRPGSLFKNEITEKFRSADIIICLVTNKFLNHPFVLEFERPIIIDKHDNYPGVETVIPIIVGRTSDYINSWLGQLELTTLPSTTCKAFVDYDTKDHPTDLIKNKLDDIFNNFQNRIVNNRIDVSGFNHKERDYTGVIVLLVAIALISVLYFTFKSENISEEPIINTINPNYLIDTNDYIIEYREPLKYNNNRAQNDTFETKVQDFINEKRISELQKVGVDMCSEKSNTNVFFPRDIVDYGYYGKEKYGVYESCQGLNESGYKPCKKNREWYIVNEKEDLHIKLDFDSRTHKDIFAIRPLLNGIGEVYYHDGQSKYLSFCISLSDGEIYD